MKSFTLAAALLLTFLLVDNLLVGEAKPVASPWGAESLGYKKNCGGTLDCNNVEVGEVVKDILNKSPIHI